MIYLQHRHRYIVVSVNVIHCYLRSLPARLSNFTALKTDFMIKSGYKSIYIYMRTIYKSGSKLVTQKRSLLATVQRIWNSISGMCAARAPCFLGLYVTDMKVVLASVCLRSGWWGNEMIAAILCRIQHKRINTRTIAPVSKWRLFTCLQWLEISEGGLDAAKITERKLLKHWNWCRGYSENRKSYCLLWGKVSQWTAVKSVYMQPVHSLFFSIRILQQTAALLCGQLMMTCTVEAVH